MCASKLCKLNTNCETQPRAWAAVPPSALDVSTFCTALAVTHVRACTSLLPHKQDSYGLY